LAGRMVAKDAFQEDKKEALR